MEELKCQQLPLSPPEAFLRWADRELLGNTHARLYRHARYYDPLTERLVTGVEVTCLACGETVYLGKVPAGGCHQAYPSAPFGFMDINGQSVIHGSHSLCPHCGAQTTAVHIASFRDERIIASCHPLEITAIEGHLVLICWYISRRLNKVGREYLVVFPYEAYVVEHRKISCFKGYIKNQNCLTFTGSWRRVSRYCDCYGELGPVFPWEPGLLAGTTAENSKLDLYLRCKGKLFPITYLRLWLRHPNVENLLTCGVGQLLASLLRREISTGTSGAVTAIPTLDTVRWKEKRPAQMLGLTKDTLRLAAAQGWTADELRLFHAVSRRDASFRPERDMPLLRRCDILGLQRLMTEHPVAPVMRTVRYLLKKPGREPGLLSDYWVLAVGNGCDLSDPTVQFPQNLRNAHDNQAARQRLKKDAGLDESFQRRLFQLEDKYFIDLKLGLLIRPVTSTQELFREGEGLNHCVYSYRKRHAQGDTAIFLIRRLREPDKPYFTLELDEKTLTVRQNRGRSNCSRTSEVEQFEKAWLDFIQARRYERSASA